MVVVDVLSRAFRDVDERAAAFYAAHGFVRLPESMRLFLPMRTIRKLLFHRQLTLDVTRRGPGAYDE